MEVGEPVLKELPSGKVIKLGSASQFTIGRSVTSSIDIPSPFVSRNQCILRRNFGNDWTISNQSLLRTTLVNDEVIGENVILTHGDRISFNNYKEKEFMYYCNADDITSTACKKRKLVADGLMVPAATQCKRSDFSERSTFFEEENKKLNERLKYFTSVAENTQKSLALLETENKTLQDRLQREIQSNEQLSLKVQELEESLKQATNDIERLQLEKLKKVMFTSSTSTEPVNESNQEQTTDSFDLNNVVMESDYFHNFDYCDSPDSLHAGAAQMECEGQVEETRTVVENVAENKLSQESHSQQKPLEIDRTFLEAENQALALELTKKDEVISSLICQKEEFYSRVVQVLEQEFLCGICSEMLFNPLTLNCKHTFCNLCVTEWKKKKKECPVCRARMKNEVSPLVLDSFLDKAAEILGEEFKNRRDELKAERANIRENNVQVAKGRRRTRQRPRNLPGIINFLPLPVNILESLATMDGVQARHRRAIDLTISPVTDYVDLTSSPRASTSRSTRNYNRAR